MTSEDFSEGTNQARWKELLRALETARSRLAVAIALEAKFTPVGRWVYYRETEEKMRRYLKQLRSLESTEALGRLGWLKVLESLQKVPLARNHTASQHGEAHHLCQRLREALAPLDQFFHDKKNND